MNPSEFDQSINKLNEAVKEIRDARRCPKCGMIAVEIFDLSRPFVGRTGIYRCLYRECPIDTFDPTFKEEIS